MLARACVVAVFCGAIAGSSNTVQATPIIDGQTVAAAPSVWSGGTLVHSTIEPFSAATFTGTVSSYVYNNDIGNTNGLGAYTFVYLVENNSTSIHDIGSFTVSSFSGFLTDASYDFGTADVWPALVCRSNFGGVISFDFMNFLGSSEIAPGQKSSLLIVRTDATQWQDTMSAVIDGSSADVPSLAPLASPIIPEPGSIALAASALASLSLVALRRRMAR